jgi:ribosomal-protein-alanine N-acetyltransferase
MDKFVKEHKIVISSERLYFKEFTKGEFDLFYSVFSNGQVMKYALMDKYESEKDILPYFNRVLENNTACINRKAFEFAVYSCEDDSFVGFADIEVHNKNAVGGCGEIGYFLLPEFWGKGYATEIAKMLLDICFKNINLHRVSARCNSNNLQSERVMKKIGMIKEGEFRKVRFKNNQWENEYQYSILIEEWEKDLTQYLSRKCCSDKKD